MIIFLVITNIISLITIILLIVSQKRCKHDWVVIDGKMEEEQWIRGINGHHIEDSEYTKVRMIAHIKCNKCGKDVFIDNYSYNVDEKFSSIIRLFCEVNSNK